MLVPEESVNPYHDLDYCGKNQEIDLLLKQYQTSKDLVLSLMKEEPEILVAILWKDRSPLAHDEGCHFQAGRGEERTPFLCSQCLNLTRLTRLDSKTHLAPFLIRRGSLAGKHLSISQVVVSKVYLEWSEHYPTQEQKYSQFFDFGKIEELHYLNGDSFTINLLLNWELQDRFKKKALPHFQEIYTAFRCGRSGYLLAETTSLGTIYDLGQRDKYVVRGVNSSTGKSTKRLRLPIVHSIIIQLLVLTNELTAVRFFNPNLSPTSLLLSEETLSYRYDGVQVQGPVTLKLAHNLSGISATLDQVHYYSEDLLSSLFSESTLFLPSLETKESSGIAYRLTTSTMSVYLHLRSLGLPLYLGSWELYTSLLALMSEETLARTVYSDYRLSNLWSLMWLDEDQAKVEARIQESWGHPVTSKTIKDWLRGVWLRADILVIIWKLIKTWK